jgi:hypothetical protein
MDVWPSGGGALAELITDECWDLLRSRTVGRIAWQGDEGLTVVPLNYVVDHAAVLVRTAPYTALGREAPDRDVAFQVDDVHPESRSGWSVLVRGRCRLAPPPPEGETPDVWVSGARWLVLRIEVRTITGRRLRSDSF